MRIRIGSFERSSPPTIASAIRELIGTGSSPAGEEASHMLEAFALEVDVADGEDLVDQQEIGLEMSGERVSETGLHSRAVGLKGRVDRRVQPGEGHDLVQQRAGGRGGNPRERGSEQDVLPTRQKRVEAGS